VLEVLYHHAKSGGARISPAAGAAKNVEFFVCLSVCLLVRHAFERQRLCARNCTPDFAMKASEYRKILMPLDRGRFVVVQPCSALSDCCQLATPLNVEVQKRPTNFFSPTEGNRINRSRRNLARKHIPRVCYSIPNLALIGKRGSVQEPLKMSKFTQNCGFWPPEANTMNTFR